MNGDRNNREPLGRGLLFPPGFVGPIMTFGPLAPGDFRLLLVQEAQAGVFQRWYMTDAGDIYFTYNASYSNSTHTWSQDDATRDSWLSRVLYGNYAIRRKVAGAGAWADAAWDAEDLWAGSYSESATTRLYDFGIYFSVRTVGDYVGNCIPFAVEFPFTPTSLTFSITSSAGCNAGSIFAWGATRRGTQFAVQTTAFAGWCMGQLIVGY